MCKTHAERYEDLQASIADLQKRIAFDLEQHRTFATDTVPEEMPMYLGHLEGVIKHLGLAYRAMMGSKVG